jgi:predicted metalloprotease with PDZ domain
LISRSKFIEQMNDILSAYYTSPAIALTSVECTRDAWTNTHAQRLPYYRGVLYLLHLDAMIRRESIDSVGYESKGLRGPVNEMVRRRFAGETYTFDDLFRILADHTDIDIDEAMNLYMNMSAGNWIVPPPSDLVGSGATVLREDQRRYDAGYTTTTDRHGDIVISSVRPDSNAYQAGCRVGDILTWSRYSFGSMDDYQRNHTMTLRRPGASSEKGDEFSVEFWPRSEVMVPSWQYV